MIKLLVDSASDIDESESKEFGINVIPLIVTFGETEYLDGVNLSHREFFEKLIESDELPKTSQINDARFEEEFQKLSADGSELIVVTISSKLSGTYSAAVRASKKFEKVYVVDSLNACVGERLVALLGKRLIDENKLSAKEIVDELNKQKKRVRVLAILDTLKYLKKGGRISALTAFTGELLSIKPAIAVVDGEIKMAGKAMGSKKSNNLLNQLLEKSGGVDFSMPYGLVYSGLSDELLQKYIKDSKAIWEGKTDNLPVYMIGSTIGTHIGPGAVGVSFFANNEK